MKYAGQQAIEAIKKRRIHKEKSSTTEPSSGTFTATFPLTRFACTSTDLIPTSATVNISGIRRVSTGTSTFTGIDTDGSTVECGASGYWDGTWGFWDANAITYSGVTIGRTYVSITVTYYTLWAKSPAIPPDLYYMSGLGNLTSSQEYAYKVIPQGESYDGSDYAVIYSWVWRAS